MPRYNPFKPGSIVHTGMFSGRYAELKALTQALYQTQNGNPSHFIIHGEKGIGKSSLLFYIDGVAEGGIPTLDNTNHSFLTVNVVLEPTDDYHQIVHKIAREFQRSLDRNEQRKKILKDIWAFVTNWEVLGVKYNKDSNSIPPDQMIEELTDKVAAVGEKLLATKGGVYIFIDEADKPSEKANLGEFVKIFTERLSRRKCNNAALGIVGLSNVIDKMRFSHPSSVRIFTAYELKQLLPTEREDAISNGISEANVINQEKTSIDPAALRLISNISEGYPHFIQQYAFSSFDYDTDLNITESDVRQSLIKENGGLDQLGIRYFENMYSVEISSLDYRMVLQTMAQEDSEYVSRKTILEKSKLKTHTLDNAISALSKKNIILPKKDERGIYRLPSNSFAAWIRAFKLQNNTAAKK